MISPQSLSGYHYHVIATYPSLIGAYRGEPR